MNHPAQRLLLTILTFLALTARAHADDPMKTGLDALSRNDYAKAIEAFRDATGNDKTKADAYYYLGLTYFKADSSDQAVIALTQAKELAPGNAKIYELIGDVYMIQHVYVGAIDQYRKGAEIDSTNVGLLLKLAETNRKVRKYPEAVTGYLQVLRYDSLNGVALTQLGNIYVRAKQWQNALPVYIRLAKQEPDSMNVQSNFVHVLAENGYWKDILPVAEKVLQRDPSNNMVQAYQAEAFAKTGNSAEAINKYRNVNMDSMRLEDLLSLARAYRSVEKYDTAAMVYRKVLSRDSTRCDVPYDLGSTLMKLKQYEEAVGMFARKIACDTSSGYQFAAHLNSAMSLMQLKQFEAAQDHINKSIAIRPENIQAWQTLAQCDLQIGDVDAAITAYKKVIDIANMEEGKYDAQLEEATKMIGIEYLIMATKAKDAEAKRLYGLSLEYLKKAVVLKPTCEVLLYTAQAAQNSNNKEDAKKYYCKIIKACPNTPEAKKAQQGLEILNMKCE